MSSNAELWCRPGNERTTLLNWLREHNIIFDEDMETEELRQLYVDIECGKYK